MDIFSVDFIKGNNEILYVAYTMQKNRHSESIAVYYRESGSEDNIKMHYIAEDVPLGSSWMQLMDYDMPDSPHTLDIERRLTDIAEYLPVYIDDGVCVKIYLLWNEWCRGELARVWLEDKHLKDHMDLSSNKSSRNW